MLKIGVLGAGHLGKIHLKILKNASFAELVGFHDPNTDIAAEVYKTTGIQPFNNLDELIAKCDIIDIVTPTTQHFECAEKALKACKHLFIEKPITSTLEEAKKLSLLREEANVKVQIGHVERFNPAFVETKHYLNNPMFIETHRLAQFNPRGTDVSVILDLMIHDIDIVLSVVDSNIRSISASGVAVVSDSPDIANARIEFDNGCVANLTASRISMKNMRKSRFFQKDSYISVDFLEKKSEIIKMSALDHDDPFAVVLDLGQKGKKRIEVFSKNADPVNAIEEELKSLVHAIENNTVPVVSLHDGYRALRVADEIMKKMKSGVI